MANPTTNYGFVLPTSTDLVTDLPADFDVALQGVDTRLKALQPGTTLGDLAYSSATANTNTRLAIGSTNQVLTVSGGVPAWAAVPSTSALTLITTSSPSATSTVNIDDCFSSTYQTYQVYYNFSATAGADIKFRLRSGGTTATSTYVSQYAITDNTTWSLARDSATNAWIVNTNRSSNRAFGIVNISNPFVADVSSFTSHGADPTGNGGIYLGAGSMTNATSYDGLSIFVSSGNFTGSIRIYGVKNS